VPPPGPGSPSLAPRPGVARRARAALSQRGSPPPDLAPTPARSWHARPACRPRSRRGTACPRPARLHHLGHVSLPLHVHSRSPRLGAAWPWRPRAAPPSHPRGPQPGARSACLRCATRARLARPWRPHAAPDPAMARPALGIPTRIVAPPGTRRSACPRPRHGRPRTARLARPLPLHGMAPAQRDSGPTRLRLARPRCPCVARRVSAALRAHARVVRVVLWHGSSCPWRARLPPP
jgi:hypothetical protein